MPSHQSLSALQPDAAVEPRATRPSSSADSRPPHATFSKEVITMARRISRVLFGRLDHVRIDAHRRAVERELGMSRPIL